MNQQGMAGGRLLLLTVVMCLAVAGAVWAHSEHSHWDSDQPHIRAGAPKPATAGIAADPYQVILDVEDTCFDFLNGDWALANTGGYVGYYYFTLPGPGTGANRGRWIAEGLPPGEYLVEFYCNNGDYPANARYEVIHAEGITTVTANMNFVGAGWHTLGTFNFGRTGVVTITDSWQGAGSLIACDALRYTGTGPAPAPPVGTVKARIGLCIDDVGQADPANASTPLARMLALPLKMTYAILAETAFLTQSANAIHAQGSEVILHQSMAAITIANPGFNAITDNMTLDQVRSTLAENLDSLPHVKGMNNHTGSLITQQRDKMNACMDVLKERGLFFFDSRTFTKSVGYDVARERGLLTADRDLFIDGNGATEAKALIRSLALRALHDPHNVYIGIGHVRAGTAQALEELVPELEAMGVEVCPISELLSVTVETEFQPEGAGFDKTGYWAPGPARASKGLRHGGALHAEAGGFHLATAVFTPDLPVAGSYRVWGTWASGTTAAQNAASITARVEWAQGITEFLIDQRQGANDWFPLGRYNFKAGAGGSVELHDAIGPVIQQYFRADAIKFEYAGPETTFDIWAVK